MLPVSNKPVLVNILPVSCVAGWNRPVSWLVNHVSASPVPTDVALLQKLLSVSDTDQDQIDRPGPDPCQTTTLSSARWSVGQDELSQGL